MKYITILFAIISINANCQDTTRTPIGYTIDLPHLYVLVDTIKDIDINYIDGTVTIRI